MDQTLYFRTPTDFETVRYRIIADRPWFAAHTFARPLHKTENAIKIQLKQLAPSWKQEINGTVYVNFEGAMYVVINTRAAPRTPAWRFKILAIGAMKRLLVDLIYNSIQR